MVQLDHSVRNVLLSRDRVRNQTRQDRNYAGGGTMEVLVISVGVLLCLLLLALAVVVIITAPPGGPGKIR